MIGFIVTGHGQFATGMLSALTMIAGDKPALKAVTFDESEADTFGQRLGAAIDELSADCEGVMIFADLLGGTPFNQSVMLAGAREDVEVVAGVSLPILLELCGRRKESTSLEKLHSLAEKASAISFKIVRPADVAVGGDGNGGAGAEADDEEGI